MKSNSDIINELLKTDELMLICKMITKQNILSKDLYQEVMLRMLEMNNKKINELYYTKEIRYYIISIFRNEFYNKYSKFNKLYKEQTDIDINEYNINETIEELQYNIFNNNEKSIDINIIINAVDEILNDYRNWNNLYDVYQKELFEMYYKLNEYNIINGKRRDVGCKKQKSTYRRIEENTGIDHTSVFLTIKETTEYIKSLLYKKGIL